MVVPFPEIENEREADDQLGVGHEFEMLMKLLREGVKKAAESLGECLGEGCTFGGIRLEMSVEIMDVEEMVQRKHIGRTKNTAKLLGLST